jgi:hypothetical protein
LQSIHQTFSFVLRMQHLGYWRQPHLFTGALKAMWKMPLIVFASLCITHPTILKISL